MVPEEGEGDYLDPETRRERDADARFTRDFNRSVAPDSARRRKTRSGVEDERENSYDFAGQQKRAYPFNRSNVRANKFRAMRPEVSEVDPANIPLPPDEEEGYGTPMEQSEEIFPGLPNLQPPVANGPSPTAAVSNAVASVRNQLNPVGMAQRIRYKIQRKIQGLVSEYNRLEHMPTKYERNMMVRTKAGRMSLRDSHKRAVVEELKNLKADVMADGFDQFLLNVPSSNHYKRVPITSHAFEFFNQQPALLTHYERSGVTQQYAGGSRLGYRYAK